MHIVDSKSRIVEGNQLLGNPNHEANVSLQVNLKIKRDLPSKLKFDCNSSLSSAGTKGSHEKRARRRSKSFLNASDCRINWNTGITKGREKSIEIQ